MTAIMVNLPDALLRHLQHVAQQQQLSPDQFVASAVAEKMSAVLAVDFWQTELAGANRADFEAVLARVPDDPPPPGDKILA